MFLAFRNEALSESSFEVLQMRSLVRRSLFAERISSLNQGTRGRSMMVFVSSGACLFRIEAHVVLYEETKSFNSTGGS